MIVTIEDCIGVDRPIKAGYEYATEASDVGIAPGAWPSHLPTTLGNGQSLWRGKWVKDSEHELIGVIYDQPNTGIRVMVYND